MTTFPALAKAFASPLTADSVPLGDTAHTSNSSSSVKMMCLIGASIGMPKARFVFEFQSLEGPDEFYFQDGNNPDESSDNDEDDEEDDSQEEEDEDEDEDESTDDSSLAEDRESPETPRRFRVAEDEEETQRPPNSSTPSPNSSRPSSPGPAHRTPSSEMQSPRSIPSTVLMPKTLPSRQRHLPAPTILPSLSRVSQTEHTIKRAEHALARTISTSEVLRDMSEEIRTSFPPVLPSHTHRLR
jgi:hypothetical protein